MENKIRLVQMTHPERGRRVAMVMEPTLVLLRRFDSVYELALEALEDNRTLAEMIRANLSDEILTYDEIYEGRSQWHLLPSFDHPRSPFSCLVSGTGLTHHNSALNRQMMHGDLAEKPTDSLVMYEMGLKGGSPKVGEIGVQPEWFYKGNGSVLRAHRQTLEIPSFGEDGGEEPEIAGLYIVDKGGKPWRIGFTTANEFSDHVMEKINYLYLAPSKIRHCSIGPELVIDQGFESFSGEVFVSRGGNVIWSSSINSGERNMSHNLSNLEYHHFKYDSHRIPLQAHVHFFGADAFSFGSKLKLDDGDKMKVRWEGMGRPLENSVHIAKESIAPIVIQQL
jgi:hypothetical protein